MSNSPIRNSENRARLGRGLAALLGDSRVEVNSQTNIQGVKQVPIEFVRSNPRNPRKHFDESDLDDLAASIREKGIIQPIVVRVVDGVGDTYEIVAGERRWRAAQRAGQHTVPVLPMQLSDREAVELSIIENVQRADLNALEEARGYSQLAAEYGYNHSDIGKIIGKSRSYIANTLRLLALPEHTQELLSSGAISPGHARALLPLDNPNAVADRIVANGLTVRDVENLSSSEKSSTPAKVRVIDDPNTRELERKISECLGVDAKIVNGIRTRQIRIKFKTLEQLDHICGKLIASV